MAALERVLHSGKWWRGSGEEVEAFEREFAEFHDCAHALAVCNGTQALEISLSCLGVGLGDEVIIPAFTFVATAGAPLTIGAIPVPVDIDPETYTIDVTAVRGAITSRTRAIIPVHLAGGPCEMDALGDVSRAAGVPIVSDAAHAHGARWKGTSLAALSLVSIYSFQSVKLLTAGEGGALVTNDTELARHAWLKHTYGRPKGDRRYQHLELGTNSRMTEFQGAMLRVQLARFSGQLREREDGAARLDEILGRVDGIDVAKRFAGTSVHSHYMYMIRLREKIGIRRDTLVDALVAEGVPAFRAYPAIPDLEMFRETRFRDEQVTLRLKPDAVREGLNRHAVPAARAIAEESIWLHHAVLLGGPKVQESVAHAFLKVITQKSRLAAREHALSTTAG